LNFKTRGYRGTLEPFYRVEHRQTGGEKLAIYGPLQQTARNAKTHCPWFGKCALEGFYANQLCPCQNIGKPLLQVDGLVMPGFVELCTPHLVHTLVLGTAEGHGRSEPNIEIAKIFQSPD